MKKIIGFLLAILVFSPIQAFFDVSPEFPSRHVFEHLRDIKVMPSPDGYFHPQKLITRAEALTYSLRAGGISVPNEFTIDTLATDIDPNSWFAPVYARARALKILSAREKFFPEQLVSRAEFLAFLLRGMQANMNEVSNFTPYFSENEISENDWFYTYFKYAQYYGILKPSTLGIYTPQSPVSKEEAATIIFSQLKLFHGGESAKIFAHLQAQVQEFLRLVNNQKQEQASKYLESILNTSRSLSLIKNDKDAIASLHLSRSIKYLGDAFRGIKYDKKLFALENLYLAQKFAQKSAKKSESFTKAPQEILRIIAATISAL